LIGREGSSPDQMRALQDRAEEIIHSNPDVMAAFTMTGGGQFLQSNQGLTFIMLKPPGERAPIPVVAGEMMGRMAGSIPGLFAFLRPFPVLEITTGATQQLQGNYAFSISGVNPDQVYDAGQKMMARIYANPEFPKIFETASSDYYSN